LVGGIDKSRLIGRVTSGVSPGNEHPPGSLELFGGDEFVVVGRVSDVGHSGRSSCGGVDERRWMGSNEVHPSNKPNLYSS